MLPDACELGNTFYAGCASNVLRARHSTRFPFSNAPVPSALLLLTALALGVPPTEPHLGTVYNGRTGGLRIATPREEKGIEVDGVLSEPAWRKAALRKVNGSVPGLLSAVDNRDATFDGRQSPVFTVLRVQRDMGTQSRGAFNRLRGWLDFLFSYLPTPDTVVFFRYGNTSRADRPGGTGALQLNRGVFFA
jgi:hypothetical protein